MTLFAQTPVDPVHLASSFSVADPALRRELEALSRERDEEIRSESLLSLAGRQERAGHEDVAAGIYAQLEGSSVAERARERFQALTGEGANLGLRSEVLARRFWGEVTNPAMLFGMGAAGTLFRATRAAVLARSLTAPAGLLTRGFGATATASLAGFALEAPTFALTTRLGNEALGRHQEWGIGDVARDVGSGYLLLGGLRSSGALFGGLSRAAGLGSTGLSPLLLRQGGMYGGILLGHGLERLAGLRPAQPLGTTLLDSLAMLFQFNVAGRLSRAALGENFVAWERGMDRQAAELQLGFRFPGLAEGRVGGFGPELAFAASGRAPQGEANALEAIRNEPMRMTGEAKGGRYDTSGIEILRRLKTMKFTNETDPVPELRTWIDSVSEAPIAVARIDGFKTPSIIAINRAFSRIFGFSEAAIAGKGLDDLLPEGVSKSFIMSRVLSQKAGLSAGMNALSAISMSLRFQSYAEFDPTRMPFVDRYSVGAGVYRRIGGNIYALGIFTALEAPTMKAPSFTVPPPATSSRTTSGGLPGVSPSAATDHFRKARAALNGGDGDPGDKNSR